MNSKKLIVYGGATLTVLLLAGIFFSLSTERSDASRKAEIRPRGESLFTDPSTRNFRTPETSRLSRALVAYRKWSRFPPFSRPLDDRRTDIIKHSVVPVPDQVLPMKDLQGEVKKSPYACALQPLAHTVTEGQSMRVTMDCGRARKKGKPGTLRKTLPVRIHAVALHKVEPSRRVALAATAVRYNDEGRDGDAVAGDGIVTFVYKPARSDWGPLELDIKFSFPEDKTAHQFSLSTGVFSSPTAPARFTDRVSERMEKGSLVLSVELDVKEPGRYRIYGNLRAHGKNGPYIAVARAQVQLKPGRQEVPLMFYGKIFHEKEMGGRFVLTGLRGYRDTYFIDPEKLNGTAAEVGAYLKRMREEVESENMNRPAKQVIPSSSKHYATKNYELSRFMERDWNSPKKQARLRQLSAVQ